jgi:hypothetical protein
LWYNIILELTKIKMDNKNTNNFSFRPARMVFFEGGPKLNGSAEKLPNSQTLAETMLKEMIKATKTQTKDALGRVTHEGYDTDPAKMVKFLNRLNVWKRGERDKNRAGVKRDVGTWLGNHLKTKKGYTATGTAGMGKVTYKKGSASISPRKFAKIQDGIYKYLLRIRKKPKVWGRLIAARSREAMKTVKETVSRLSVSIDKVVKPRIKSAINYAVRQSLKLTGAIDFSKVQNNPSLKARMQKLFTKLKPLFAAHGYSLSLATTFNYKLTNSPVADKKLKTNTQRTQFFAKIKAMRV